MPRTRKVRPDLVPAGTLSVTGFASVGTVTVAPSAASAKVTGTVRVRSRPLRPNSSLALTRHHNIEVAGRTTVLSGPAPPGDPDPLAVLDARRARAP